MKIVILTEATNTFASQVEDYFEHEGHVVRTSDPRAGLTIDKYLLQTDLVLIAGRPTWPAIYAGIFAKAHGVHVVPDPEMIVKIYDRVECQFLAREIKIKMPKAYYGYPEVLEKQISKKDYPFIVKPYPGLEEYELKVIRNPKEIRKLLPPGEPAYLEKFVHGRLFLAIYVGDNIRVFKKKRLYPYEDQPRKDRNLKEVLVPRTIRQILQDWRNYTGINIGKMELILDDITGRYYMTHPGTFPSTEFENWPGADKIVANYLLKKINLGRYKRYREALTFTFYVHEKFPIDGHGVTVDRTGISAQSYIAGDQAVLFYALHPVRVCGILMSAGFNLHQDEDLLIAALLHDVVEETTTTMEEIRGRFGDRVVEIVEEATKPEQAGGKMDWLRSFQVSSRYAKVLKMADRLDKLLDKDSTSWPLEEKKRYAQNAKLIYQICEDAHSGLGLELKRAIVDVLGEGDWNV